MNIFFGQILFAWMVLTGDVLDVEKANNPLTRGIMREIATQQEWVETHCIFTDSQCFADDLELIRARAIDLADAPHLWECMYLPEYDDIQQALAFSYAYQRTIRSNLAFHLNDERGQCLRDINQETERLQRIWTCMGIAKSVDGCYKVDVRRNALKEIQDAIGLESFRNRDFPPYVPVWRFAPR